MFSIAVTITGLGSQPDYTLRIENDGTPVSYDFLQDFCNVVTTACSQNQGAALQEEIEFCVTDSTEFLDYTMAQFEQMVAEAQQAAQLEGQPRQQQSQQQQPPLPGQQQPDQLAGQPQPLIQPGLEGDIGFDQGQEETFQPVGA